MLQRQPIKLPQDVYPIDPWRIIEKRFFPRLLAQTETIFTTSNGYLGMRGSFEEGAPAFENGAYINGFYETWPICYGEEAHGFAKEGQAIVNVPDSKIIRLFVDDELFSLENARLVKFERILDFRSGTLDREIVWEMDSGKRIAINSRRLVSYEHRHLAAISYEVTLLNATARVMISSEIRLDPRSSPREDDPRLHHNRQGRSLHPRLNRRKGARILLGHQTGRSKLGLISAVDHKIETDCSCDVKSESSEDAGKCVISFSASPEKPTKIIKYMAYHTSHSPSFEELSVAAEETLEQCMARGFQDILAGQRRYLDDFWARSDVQFEAEAHEDHRAGEFQQALRFNLFQIHQASVRVEDNGIPAKATYRSGLRRQLFLGHRDVFAPLLHLHSSRNRQETIEFQV